MAISVTPRQKRALLCALAITAVVVAGVAPLGAHAQTAAQDRVNPADIGFPDDITFEIYSGYLDIWNNGSQWAHYTFVTSQRDKDHDPLVLWLNGGPGCSSLLGLMQENGPFLLLGTNTTLRNNLQYSWNRIANMLYLESPPGVGFSLNNITGYDYNDNNTAEANFWALNRFFDRFGEFSKHRVWISGESYAGIYIPFLADQIRQNNLEPALDTYKIPLEGFLIGNGAWILDWNMIGNYQVNQYANHQFLNKKDHEDYYANCFGRPNSPACRYVENVLNNVMLNTDVYNIYTYTYGYQKPKGGDQEGRFASAKTEAEMLLRHAQRRRDILAGAREDVDEHHVQRVVREGDADSATPNLQPLSPDQNIGFFFNNITIQRALHVYDKAHQFKRDFVWEQCNNQINANYHSANDSTHLYPGLLRAGYQILIYSGNIDAAVSTSYTEYCFADLFNNFGVSVTLDQPWSLWGQLPSKQLGGWVTRWKNNDLLKHAPQNYLTFAVVRAAGHMVPTDQPEAAYYLFYNFTNGLLI